MKTGDVVTVSGAYFKNDNGVYRIEHTPGDNDWLGNEYCLKKIKKDGSEVKNIYNIAFWPLSACTTNREKNRMAKIHNAEFATIEIINFQAADKKKPQEGIRFMYNGIKVDGELYKGWYSMAGYIGFPGETIVIYATAYNDFPAIEGLDIENDSDIMTDYFEKDRIYVKPDNKFYPEVRAAYDKQHEKWAARYAA